MAVTRLTTNGLTGTKYDIASADNYYMEPIATTLVGAGGVSSVTFSNIPSTYKHLQLRVFAQSNRTSFSVDNLFGTVNGDSSASYAQHSLYASASTTPSALFGGNASQTALTIGGINSSVATSVFTSCIVDYLDYANTNKFKTIRSFNGYDVNGTVGTGSWGGQCGLYSNLWMNTAPITSLSFTVLSGTAFTQHSRFSLYGIKG